MTEYCSKRQGPCEPIFVQSGPLCPCSFLFPPYFLRQDAREVAAFIRPMLEMDPDKRASAQEMLAHPWLQGLGADADEVSLITEKIPVRETSRIGINSMWCRFSQYILFGGPTFCFGDSGFCVEVYRASRDFPCRLTSTAVPPEVGCRDLPHTFDSVMLVHLLAFSSTSSLSCPRAMM